MTKLKWSVTIPFDFVELEKKGKVDLMKYIQTATLLNRIPQQIKRIITWLLETKKYKIEGTFLIVNKKPMTDGQEEVVAPVETPEVPAEEAAEATEETTEVAEEAAE